MSNLGPNASVDHSADDPVDKIDKRVTPNGEGMPPSRGSTDREADRARVVILVVLGIGAAVAAYFVRPGADTERALLPETTAIDGATMYRYDVHKGGLFGPDAVGGDSEWVLGSVHRGGRRGGSGVARRVDLRRATGSCDRSCLARTTTRGRGDGAHYMDPASSRTLYVNWYDQGDQISFDLWVGLVEG